MLPPARCLALLLAATALAACAGKGRPRADAAGPLPDAPKMWMRWGGVMAGSGPAVRGSPQVTSAP